MSEPPPPRPAAAQPMRGDLTRGPLVPTLIGFALPQLIGNVMQTLNGSINAVWVGRLLGNSALAATANANIIMFLLFALVFGFGMAATVRVGQAWGRKDVIAARASLGTAITLTGALSLATSVCGWILAPRLLDWLATPGDSYGEALIYLRVVFIANPVTTITIMLVMGMRGAGDAATPLRFMILTSLLDVGLNPLLIMGAGPIPALGIAGSALATVIAGVIGLGALIAYLYARDLPLRLRGPEWRFLRPRRDELAYILAKGLPMGAQMLTISGAGVIMIALVNREGLVMASAYGALLQVWNYIGMPAMAIGAAVSAMVAQHIGASREDRIDAIGLAGALANLAITGALMAVMLLFDRPVLALFLGGQSPAVPLAIHIQTLAIWTYLPFGVTIVLFGTLRAYGVVYAQLLVLFASMYAVRYGTYWLLYPALRADALWYSLIVSSLMSMALTMTVYRAGSWRARMLARIDAASGTAA